MCYMYMYREIQLKKCQAMESQREHGLKMAHFNALVQYKLDIRPIKQKLQQAAEAFLGRANGHLLERLFYNWHQVSSGASK